MKFSASGVLLGGIRGPNHALARAGRLFFKNAVDGSKAPFYRFGLLLGRPRKSQERFEKVPNRPKSNKIRTKALLRALKRRKERQRRDRSEEKKKEVKLGGFKRRQQERSRQGQLSSKAGGGEGETRSI